MSPEKILSLYGFATDELNVQPFGTGLINHTWRVEARRESYILQRLNDTVFKRPEEIAENIENLKIYLNQGQPNYLFVSPIPALDGRPLCIVPEGAFRLFPFVNGSVSFDVVTNASIAQEAAKQFGKFTHLLDGFEAEKLHITIPSFHDLTLRYDQFLLAVANGNADRIRQSRELIDELQSHARIVSIYKKIKALRLIRMRVTHHDTKISNVLFDNHGNGLCVIDLDTVMPGYFISDLGDMMRTYLSPVSEEAQDFDKIEIREDFYHAIVKGFLGEMDKVLSTEEKNLVFYSGEFMIYMQALRFLTDHLNDDIYYGARYPNHNFNRAMNQAILLKRYMGKKALFAEFE